MSEETGIKMADVVDVVGAHYGVSKIHLKSMRRTSDLIEPRHVAYYVGAKITGHTLPQIGAFMQRDHTTVLYGRDKIAQAIVVDQALAERVAAIEIASMAMAQVRRENMIAEKVAQTPQELARLISERGAYAACRTSVNEILELCEAVIDAAHPPPPPSPLYLVAYFATRQEFFRARPNVSNRKARDAAIEALRDVPDAFVASIVAAFDFMRKNEFTMAEKKATQKFHDIVHRAEIWLEQNFTKSGEME